MRWLDQGMRLRKAVKPTITAPHGIVDEAAIAKRLLVKRSHAAMSGRLLWQHFRQSAWLIALMSVLYVVLGGGILPYLASGSILRLDELIVPWSMAVVASLMGSMVFLPDQERRHYRFFAEHNVPPRHVWLTRQLPWIITLFISTLIVCFFWGRRGLDELLYLIAAARDRDHPWPYSLRPYLYLPPFGVGLAMVAVSYTAGQWVSMFVRSGIMAGFLGLLLSGVLCGWTLLMYTMQVGFLWTVLPIPFLLLWATWLRAPDWISENKRW